MKKLFYPKSRKVRKSDFIDLFDVKTPVYIFTDSDSGNYFCVLYSASGYIHFEDKSCDNLMREVTHAYNESLSNRLRSNPLTLSFVVV